MFPNMATKKSVFFEEQRQKEHVFISDSIADKVDILPEISNSNNYVLINKSRFPTEIFSIKNKKNKIFIKCLVKMLTFTQFVGSKNSTIFLDGVSYECELKSLKITKKNTEDGLLTISILNA